MNTSFWKSGHTPTLFSAFLYFDLSGGLYRKGIVDLDSDYGKILMADSAGTEYLVLYTCRKDFEMLLDFASDEVHIFTRTGDASFVNFDLINAEL